MDGLVIGVLRINNLNNNFMKTKLLLFLFFSIFLQSCRSAKCQSDYQDMAASNIPDDGRAIKIPVVVHVLYKNDKEKINPTVIDNMIASLNDDFAGNRGVSYPRTGINGPNANNYNIRNSNISFELAKILPDGSSTESIIYKKTNTSVFRYQQRKPFAESKLIDPYHYLNVYICDTNTGAYTPMEKGNHGIVIDYTNANATSNTLTHETGHWLGLYHIFEGGCSDGDGIKDTESQKKLFGDLKYPYISCSDQTMVTNFMGYTDKRDFFTPKQVEAMRKYVFNYMELDKVSKSIDNLQFERLNALEEIFDNNLNYSNEDIQSKYIPFTPLVMNNLINFDSKKNSYLIRNLQYKSFEFSPDVEKTNSFNWQAEIINELATIIATNFEREISNFALQNLFKNIVNPDVKKENQVYISSTFSNMFPNSYNYILELYYSKSTSTGINITELQAKVKTDLAILPENFRKNPEKILTYLNKNPDLKDFFTLSNELYESVSLGYSLPEIVNRISSVGYTDNSKVSKIVTAVSIIANSLEVKSENNIWLDPVLYLQPSMISDPAVNNIYFILNAKLSTIDFVGAYLNDSNNSSERINKIFNLILVVNKLNKSYQFIKGKDFQLLKFNEQIAYILSINEVYSGLIDVITKDFKFNSKINIGSDYANTVQNIYTTLNFFYTSKYPEAISSIVTYFGSHLGNYTSNPIVLTVVKIATAKDEKEVKEVLKSYIQPIGSSSLKRTSAFNITLNSYAGICGGFENVNSNNSDSFYGGISAPIGFAFSFWPSRYGSFSLLTEILDLGSLVNVRLKDDNTQYEDLKFEHFLSPGIGLLYNIKNSPFTIGFKYNYLSNLRKVTYNDGVSDITIPNVNVSRISFNLLVDIPLFKIVSK
jgi:Pregnancy-associated plasma protein-A